MAARPVPSRRRFPRSSDSDDSSDSARVSPGRPGRWLPPPRRSLMDLSAYQLDFFARDCSRPFPLSPVPASDADPGGVGSAASRPGAARGEPHAGSHLTALGPQSSTRMTPAVSAGMREVPGVSAGVFPRSQVSRPFPDLPAGAGGGYAPCAPSLSNVASNVSLGLTSGIVPFSDARCDATSAVSPSPTLGNQLMAVGC